MKLEEFLMYQDRGTTLPRFFYAWLASRWEVDFVWKKHKKTS